MKKIIIIIMAALCLVIVTTIIYLLVVVMTIDKSDVIYKSYNGELASGMGYTYFGTDRYRFNLTSFKKNNGFIFFPGQYDLTLFLETPEEVAKKAEELSNLTNKSLLNVHIRVYYDKKTNSWVAMNYRPPDIDRLTKGWSSIIIFTAVQSLIP